MNPWVIGVGNYEWSHIACIVGRQVNSRMRQENGSFSRRGSWRCTLESRTPLNVQLTSTVAVSHSLSFFSVMSAPIIVWPLLRYFDSMTPAPPRSEARVGLAALLGDDLPLPTCQMNSCSCAELGRICNIARQCPSSSDKWGSGYARYIKQNENVVSKVYLRWNLFFDFDGQKRDDENK